MFNSLASLAQRHGKRTVIFAAVFFVIAGALGGGVASKLGPYGADDPATESVKATDRLDEDGYRDPAVVVLLQNTSPTSKAGQQRIQGVEQELRSNPDVARVTGYLETQNPDFVSRDGNSTYLAVGLKPTDDKAEQDAARRSQTTSPASPASRSAASRSPRSRSTSRSRRTCEWPSCWPSPFSSCSPSSSSAAWWLHCCR
jgi:RND superfamily putative drug exporter